MQAALAHGKGANDKVSSAGAVAGKMRTAIATNSMRIPPEVRKAERYETIRCIVNSLDRKKIRSTYPANPSECKGASVHQIHQELTLNPSVCSLSSPDRPRFA